MNTAPPPARADRLQRAEPGVVCPKCREPLPPGSFWQRLQPPPGRRPAWKLTHPRANGAGWCSIYAGEAVPPATLNEGA